MNRIILDHLKRWWLLWLVIGVANCFMTGSFLDEKHNFSALTFQLVLWLGAMQLNFDLQRGISRVQATLPLTARQIGRAWWIFSVALPALLLAATTGIAMQVHSVCTATGFPLDKFMLAVTASTCSLGAIFFLFIGMLPTWPQSLTGRLRYTFLMICLFGIIFIQPAFDTPKGILVLLGGFFLTVIGWFRTEQMAVLRATFRPGIQLGKRKPGRHQAQSGFGGLPFLLQTLFIRIGYMGITVVVWLLIMHLVMDGTSKLSPKQLLEAMLPTFSTFGYFFIFMFLLLPMMMQLRHLRSLPISTSALAALLVLLPTVPIFACGLVWAAFHADVSAVGNVFQIPSNFLTCAATLSIAAPIFVWQGLRMGSYLLIMVLVMFSTMGPLMFHAIKIPASVTALVSFSIILLAFASTRRLLKSSSQAYRPMPTNMSGWGGWR